MEAEEPLDVVHGQGAEDGAVEVMEHLAEGVLAGVLGDQQQLQAIADLMQTLAANLKDVRPAHERTQFLKHFHLVSQRAPNLPRPASADGAGC